MMDHHDSYHVTLVATPDAQISPLSGLYESFNSFGLLKEFESDLPETPFHVEIVTSDSHSKSEINGLSIDTHPHRKYNEIDRSDIVIIPLMMVKGPEWVKGRYPEIVEWLCKMYENGAILCSACTGVLLLAETGLLDGKTATIHWAFAPTFRRNFPKVHLKTEEVLITSGKNHEFVMTGGVMSWHDLALHLIARYVGPTAAQAISRFLMLQWHAEGQAPYITFSPKKDHGDALVLELQNWLKTHFAVPDPVKEMVIRSGRARRTLERRFRKATNLSPLTYVQNLRISEARQKLERTELSVEDIGFQVGYENTAFFRRLFKRITRLNPGAYRQKFHIKRKI